MSEILTEPSVVALPFEKDKQLAILGHLLENEKFFAQSHNRIEPIWFIDPYCTKVFAAKVKFFRDFNRSPTMEELRNLSVFLSEDQKTRNRINEIIRTSAVFAKEYGLDALRPELTTWMHSQYFEIGLRKAYLQYTKEKKIKEAYLTMDEMVQNIKNTQFEEDSEEKFTNYIQELENTRLEYSNALTTGLTVFDRLLTPKAQVGALLPGDMSIILAPTNTGKCWGVNTPILMFDGTVKMVQDIKENDLLMGPDSKSRKVLSTTVGKGQMYKITPNCGGDPFICNDVHVLSLRHGHSRCFGQVENIPLNEYLLKSKDFKRSARLWRTFVEFSKHRDLPMDPYVLGLWLGDGHSNKAALTTMDKEIKDAWITWVEDLGESVAIYTQSNNKAFIYQVVENCSIKNNKGFKNSCSIILNGLNLINNKHIPIEYLTASRNDRLQLLAGIIDTDGHLSKNNIKVSTKLEKLANNYAYLARSLGFKVSITKTIKTIKSINFSGEYFRLSISGTLHEIPTRLARKKAVFNSSMKNPLTTGFKIEKLGIDNYYGFTVDDDHLLLLGDFTVTHNTTAMITTVVKNIAAQKHILFITHEGRPSDIKEKLLCCFLGKTPQELMAMYKTAEGAADVGHAIKWMDRYLCYMPMNRAGLTVEEVGATIRRKQEQRIAKYKRGFDMLANDYPAKITTLQAAKGMSKRERDEIVYNYFEQLGLQYNMHVLAAIQTNREGSRVNKGQREDRLLTMEDVQESWGPMTSATNVWTINRSPHDKAFNRLIYYIDKSRSSQTGFAVVCKTDFSCSRTHGDDLGGTFYRSASTYADKLDEYLEQYVNQEIPEHLLLG